MYLPLVSKQSKYITISTITVRVSGALCTVREMAINPTKNAPMKLFDFSTTLSNSDEKSQKRFSFRRHPAQISPNLSNLSIGAPKLLKKLVWGTKCTRVVIKIT